VTAWHCIADEELA